MAIVIGEIVGNLGLNTKGFEQGLTNMEDRAKSMIKNITAPIIAFAGASVWAFDKQAQAVAQVEAGLRSTGESAGFSSKELQKMASELQNVTRYGDEEILKGVTAQLLTFTNITDTAFARTQQAALDLSARLGGDLQSSAIQLGKALNDPVANLSALSRSGIQFSKEQKTLINSLVETNRLSEAQSVILDELEKQYGGSAKAAADAGAGGIVQLKNSIGDLMEEIGGLINKAIQPMVKWTKDIVSGLQAMDEQSKQTAVVIGTLAAAIGPVTYLVIQLARAVMFLMSPLALKIAAIAAIGVAINTLIHNLKPLGERFIFYFGMAKNAVINMASSALNALGELVSYIDAIAGGALKGLAEGMKSMKNELQDPADMTAWVGPLEGLGKTFGGLISTVREFVFGVGELGENVDIDVNVNTVDAESNLNSLSKKAKSASNSLKPLVEMEISDDIYSPFKQVNYELMNLDELMSTALDNFEGLNEIALTTSPTMEVLSGIARTFTDSFGQGMANVIVQGEKLIDVLQNIGKLLASAVIQKAISIFLTGGLSGGGFFGSIADGGKGGLFGSLFGRASGGSVNAMQPYMVGERGPELFMPNMAGGIVPNHNLSNSMGSTGVVRFEIEGTKLIGLIKKSEIQFK